MSTRLALQSGLRISPRAFRNRSTLNSYISLPPSFSLFFLHPFHGYVTTAWETNAIDKRGERERINRAVYFQSLRNHRCLRDWKNLRAYFETRYIHLVMQGAIVPSVNSDDRLEAGRRAGRFGDRPPRRVLRLRDQCSV